MLGWLKRDRKPQQGMSTSVLPDELVEDILSRLPLKSICRFKCVCKSWLAFSSNPHRRQKFPRTPAGLLYRECEPGKPPSSLATSIHLARLPASDREIDTRLDFVPARYKYSNLEDCSNGLLLCYQGGGYKFEAFSNAIVCNPATKEWMAIPHTEPGPPVHRIDPRLCFDPLWSQHFYVFKFQIPRTGTIEVEVFFSENSSWSDCLWETQDPFCNASLFVNGVLYMMHFCEQEILALDAPDTSTQWLNHRIIQRPGFATRTETFNCCDGCLSQSSGVLCYAKQELDGCAVRIWSLESPDEWVVKPRVRMTDVFKRDMLISRRLFWRFDYDILAFDMERELVILDDKKADKIISVSISTGKGSQFLKIPKTFTEPCRSLFYVPYYGEVPALVRSMAQDELC
ncbi:hypothetical protein ACQ4PT_029738 [Festuca glaucescens]